MTGGNALESDRLSWANIRAPELCRPRPGLSDASLRTAWRPDPARQQKTANQHRSVARFPCSYRSPLVRGKIPVFVADNFTNRQGTIMAARPQAVVTVK